MFWSIVSLNFAMNNFILFTDRRDEGHTRRVESASGQTPWNGATGKAPPAISLSKTKSISSKKGLHRDSFCVKGTWSIIRLSSAGTSTRTGNRSWEGEAASWRAQKTQLSRRVKRNECLTHVQANHLWTRCCAARKAERRKRRWNYETVVRWSPSDFLVVCFLPPLPLLGFANHFIDWKNLRICQRVLDKTSIRDRLLPTFVLFTYLLSLRTFFSSVRRSGSLPWGDMHFLICRGTFCSVSMSTQIGFRSLSNRFDPQ